MPHKVISIATSKGGAGKTTLCICLASAFAEQGGKIALVDTDPQGSLTSWAEKADLPESISVFSESTDENRVIDLIEAASKTHHLTIVDVQGTANTLAHTAMAFSDLVIIPMKASEFDARAAFDTLTAVRAVARSRRSDIEFMPVLNCLSPAIPSRTAQAIREGFEQAGIAVQTGLSDREAFRCISAYGGSLFQLSDSQAPGLTKAKAEALDFASLVADRLGISQTRAA